MLSGTGQYALRMVLWLAERQDAWTPTDAAAASLSIPPSYLPKILRTLVEAGVLESQRGRGGGVRLARDPGVLRIADVIAPFEEGAGRRQCVLGRPHCSEQHACAAHHAWRPTADRIAAFFGGTTVADCLAAGAA